MKSLKQKQLVNQLVDLFNASSSVRLSADEEKNLRRQIGTIVDNTAISAERVDSRRVTILLSDLRGFTAMAEQYSGLEIMEALNRYFERMVEIILRHGGTIDKFMGDSIMALFGAPVALENDIEAALTCAVEMQIAMDEVNEKNLAYGMAPWYMGIGINTGEVVTGNLGSHLHSEYTAIGNQVNLVSRVEAHSLRGQILLSENTYRLARDFIEVGDINEVKVKGKKEIVRLYELLSMRRPHHLAVPLREIRKTHRVEVDLPLMFQILQGKTVLAQEYTGRIVDLSYGGMYIVSPVELEPFGNIKITLSLFLMARELTEIYVKVLRVSKLGDEYECRVEFTSIDIRAQLAIKEFIDGIVEAGRL